MVPNYFLQAPSKVDHSYPCGQDASQRLWMCHRCGGLVDRLLFEPLTTRSLCLEQGSQSYFRFLQAASSEAAQKFPRASCLQSDPRSREHSPSLQNIDQASFRVLGSATTPLFRRHGTRSPCYETFCPINHDLFHALSLGVRACARSST